MEIADKVGLTDGRINHILTNISSDKIKDEYRGGKSVEDIAEYLMLNFIRTDKIQQEYKSGKTVEAFGIARNTISVIVNESELSDYHIPPQGIL